MATGVVEGVVAAEVAGEDAVQLEGEGATRQDAELVGVALVAAELARHRRLEAQQPAAMLRCRGRSQAATEDRPLCIKLYFRGLMFVCTVL
jgi:hypothetical protein